MWIYVNFVYKELERSDTVKKMYDSYEILSVEIHVVYTHSPDTETDRS